ncbi:MAG: pyridoxal phosphate-dependent aminotransferase [Phycisphaerae bacterium]|nr:pyridoxal phosphate-dependent aminotransferase [Phycisphaerae bacterium]
MQTSTILPTMKLSERAKSIPPSITLAISAQVKELKAAGKDVIAFGAGEPDFDTPEKITNAAIEALRLGVTHYMPSSGTPEAREAIANKLRIENNIECTEANISINSGAKMSINLALMSILDPGKNQEVVVPTPAWVSYKPMIELAGGTMIEVPTSVDTGFKCTPEEIEAAITPNTKAIMLNTPSNPCGTMYAPDELRAIAVMLQKHPTVYILSDEIYDELIYSDIEHLSLGSIPEISHQVITINGLSKAYAMTGWRVGYACAPENVAKAMNTLQSQINTSITSFCYATIPVALEMKDEVEEMRKVFAKRAALMFELIQKWPNTECAQPTGAFYAFPKISYYYGKTTPAGTVIQDSVGFVQALLDETSVAVVPGTDFGGCGPDHIRLSFACSEDQIETGVSKICDWLSLFTT